MRKFFRKITPRFLLRLDDYLLTNHPLLWASRLHYLLLYGLIVYAVNCVVTLMRPIDFSHVPSLYFVEVYGFFINLLILIVWVTFQALGDFFLYGAKRSRFFSVRLAWLFMLPFVIGCFTFFSPIFQQDFRVSRIFHEQKLDFVQTGDYQRLDVGTVDDTVTKRPFIDIEAMDQRAQFRKTYQALGAKESFEIYLCLGHVNMGGFSWIQLSGPAERPSLSYALLGRGDKWDTLTFYYNAIHQLDTVVAATFNKIVYHCSIPGKIHRVKANVTVDTLMERFYFYSRGIDSFVVCDKGSILYSLVVESIRETLKARGTPETTSAYPDKELEELSANYLESVKYLDRPWELMMVVIYIGVMTGLFALMAYCSIRLFGFLPFLAALFAFCLLAGGLSSLLQDVMNTSKTFFAPLLLVIGLIGFFGIRARRRGWGLIFLQSFVLLVYLIICALPYYLQDIFEPRLLHLSNTDRGAPLYINCGIALLGGLTFAPLLVASYYRIYSRPV